MTRNSYLLLILITVLALNLRLYRLDAQSLWIDEASSWRGAQAPWPTFLDTVLMGECTPPLYFALLKIWSSVMGDSTPAMRMLSVLFGTLTVPFLGWFIGRLAGPGPACLAALFLAVAPFHIDYSQEARPYTLFPFLILAATAALSWALDRRSARRWALYAFLALLACYTHYFTAFYLAGHGAFIGLVCWKERKLWPATDWALSMVAVAVGFLPWLPFMLRSNLQSVQWLEDYLRQWTPFMQLSVTVMSLLFGCTYPLPLGIYCYLAVIILTPPAVWLAYRRSQRSGVGSRPAQSNSALAPDTCQPGDAFAITLLAVMTVVPLAIAWLFSQFRPSLMHRYVIPTVPAALALIALAIWRLRWLPLRVVLASSLAVYWLLCLQGQLADPTKPELRLTAAHIANHMKPGDGILIQPWAQNLVLSYFLRERMLPIVNEYDWRADPDEPTLSARLAPFQRVWYVQVDSKPCPIETYLDSRYSQAAAAQVFFRVPVVKLYATHQ